MIEIILEFIGQVFVEFLFQTVIMGFLRLVYLCGIILLKIITFSNQPVGALKKKYKDSASPWFLGFSFIGGMIYLITILV